MRADLDGKTGQCPKNVSASCKDTFYSVKIKRNILMKKPAFNRPVLNKQVAYRLVSILGALFSLGAISGAILIAILGSNLPDASSIRDSSLDVPLRVFSSEGLLISEFGTERREPIPIAEVPQNLINAILASEDDGFYEHPGIDIIGIARAALRNLRTGGTPQGASTITQQVARNFFLSPEQTYTRKIREILLALRLEQNLSKDEILELYINKIYLGQRAYGFGAAAEIYYGKNIQELDLAQYAMLAGLPKAPSRDNPASNPDRATERRSYVLGRMLELGMIDQNQFDAANAASVSAQRYRPNVELEAPFVAEMVRSYLLEKYGERAYEKGFRVYTTIKADLQRAADKALRKGLADYDRRHGYKGPVQQLSPEQLERIFGLLIDPEGQNELKQTLRDLLIHLPDSGEYRVAVVANVMEQGIQAVLRNGTIVDVSFETMQWAAPWINDDRIGNAPQQASDVAAAGDVVYLIAPPVELVEENQEEASANEPPVKEGENSEAQDKPGWTFAQLPEVAGALISMNPASGAIWALSGGFDYYVSKYNRVEQAQRQPGSNIKPFIYAAALDKGYTPASLISGAPIVVQDTAQGTIWRPENYSGKFFGPTRMRRALSLSLNLVSVRIVRSLGIEPTKDFLDQMGIERSGIPNGLSLALGAGTLSPMDMAGAYNVLANGGAATLPHVIDWIEDAYGNIVEQQVIRPVCRHCDNYLRPKPEEPEPEGVEQDLLADTEPVPPAELLNPELQQLPEEPLLPVGPGQRQARVYAEQVMAPVTNYLITDMMKDVVRQGTATPSAGAGP